MVGAERTRVMLVSHEATRTGAPRIALLIAHALRESGADVTTVLRAGGPLEQDFRAVSNRVRREPFIRARAVLRLFRRTRRIATRIDELVARWIVRRERPAVAYLNTVKSASYVRAAVDVGSRTILHVHEMEPMASSTLARYSLDGYYDRLRLVACSEAAAQNLSRIARVRLHSITVIPSCIDTEAVVAAAVADAPTAVPYDGATVGACGAANRGKGFDLWLEMASIVHAQSPERNIRFGWIGKIADEAAAKSVTELGIADQVSLTGEVENPYPLIAALDVFTLPSRSDAFPLVVLEAMALGRPIVAFALPGVIEQIGDAGVLVPPEQPEAMAREVQDLLNQPAMRLELGARARERVSTRFSASRFRADVVRAAWNSENGVPTRSSDAL